MENSKNFLFIVSLAVIVVAAIVIFGIESSEVEPASLEKTLEFNPASEGLKIEDITLGSGPEASCGNELTAHYTGSFTDGRVFETSLGGSPIKFIICAGEVIRGWDEGILGMNKGGKRKLTIPSSLAYGERGQGLIPPNADLVFEVELLDVKEFTGEPAAQ